MIGAGAGARVVTAMVGVGVFAIGAGLGVFAIGAGLGSSGVGVVSIAVVEAVGAASTACGGGAEADCEPCSLSEPSLSSIRMRLRCADCSEIEL